MLLTFIHMTLCMLMCTIVYIERKGHIAKFCYDRINDSNVVNKFVWVRKGANPHGPNRVTPMDPIEYEYQKPLLFYLM